MNYIVLDDATDPTKGASNVSRLVTEDKVDLIIGSSITNVSAAMVRVATESGTVQLSASPVGLPAGSDKWVFRLPQSVGIMAFAMVEHMKKQHVKTVGFIGYGREIRTAGICLHGQPMTVRGRPTCQSVRRSIRRRETAPRSWT